MASPSKPGALALPALVPAPRVLIVAAPFYRDIADGLIAGARAVLDAAGAAHELVEVPGALEVPVAIRLAAETGAWEGYVALGCVIRGETTHYETVCNDSSRGLMQLGVERGLTIGNGILKLVKTRAKELGLEPWDIKAHTGFLRHLVIRVTQAQTDSPQVMVNLVTSREEPRRLKPLSDDMVTAFPEITSVVNNINTTKASVAYGQWEVVLHGKPTITEQLLGRSFDISANSFFQTNSAQAEALYGQIVAACGLTGGEVVYDLYCGTGTIGIVLAEQAQEVAGFEMAQSAVEDASRNALANDVFNIRFFAADLNTKYFSIHAKRLKQQVLSPDVVVLDPPRAGLNPRMIPEIGQLGAGRVVYVSCNPATQVRDVRLLIQQGYRLKWAQPVDMFPHTPHIENICLLEKEQ